MNKDNKKKHGGVRSNKDMSDDPMMTHLSLEGIVVSARDLDDNEMDLQISMTGRALMVGEGQMVSSTSNLKKVASELSDGCPKQALIMSEEGDLKIAHITKANVVRKNGKHLLKLTISSDELNASGKTANDAIDLDSKDFKKEETVSIRCTWVPGYGCLG